MTQLVGRILRQPYALKTGVAALDECYVVTQHAGTQAVVEAIKSGLERDGLANFVVEVPQDGTATTPGTARKIERRPAMKSLKIYLPKVLRVEGQAQRDLDYEADILAAIDWRDFSRLRWWRLSPRTQNRQWHRCSAFPSRMPGQMTTLKARP